MIHEHIFSRSDKAGYEVCLRCGSYHSIDQKPPKELYENNYWEHSTGHSTFDEQKHNLTESKSCGISKVDKVLQYIPKRYAALEIGASPGSLLRKLGEYGYACYGVEPDSKYVHPIINEAPHCQVINGYFPDVFPDTLSNVFDYIVALDILEHCDDYEKFIKAIHRLLTPNGSAIIMLPLIKVENGCRDIDFLPSEHCWLFSESFIKEYFESLFSEVKLDFWQAGHNMIIAKK